ncbi:vanin-like protein 1 [Cylas formicarius]|uniref:vanin-like protein 1 n=1 Tax=Cylas formicarius TaxID=197179 RepID=UPI0029583816|nr:vanin-like protein 1 [Cylas formicarius]XP_060532854.1 vanin-like protein 1 [Cylas formicarius]XP_060532855.1 vanin-like protein 1 [Cylas formicarius]XP_060532856.1 vanin-like protein 1 [Cylas formicarius]
MKLSLLILTYWLIARAAKCQGVSWYNVAVVEFELETNLSVSADERLAATISRFIKTLNGLTEPLDLVIFPESALASDDPDAATELPSLYDFLLCNSNDVGYAEFLKNLSCLAIDRQTVIVVNILEKSGDSFYNTDIALAANGTVIARYRKWNLFGEIAKSKPSTLDLPVLELKNTTFGFMTCFDILFGVPGFNLTRERSVKNIIFPLNWISELPYLTALQTQQMWASEHDVTLLAAGSNSPGRGAGGTGIYLGKKGALETIIAAGGGTRTIYRNVPIISGTGTNVILVNHTETDEIDSLAVEMDDFFTLVDAAIAEHASVVLDTTNLSGCITVCHGRNDDVTCCDFDVSALQDQIVASRNGDRYTYHLVAYNGVRSFSGVFFGGVEICAVVACLNESVASCGRRFPDYSNIVWPITFEKINVSGNFSQSERRVQYPTSLLSSIRPIETRHTSWHREEVNGTTVLRTHTLEKAQNRLLTFGIYGRDFTRDRDPMRNESANGSISGQGGPNPDLSALLVLFIIAFIYV